MAHVQITMLAGRTIEQKRRAVKRITDAMCEELHVKAEKLTIILRGSPARQLRPQRGSAVGPHRLEMKSGYAASRRRKAHQKPERPSRSVIAVSPLRGSVKFPTSPGA